MGSRSSWDKSDRWPSERRIEQWASALRSEAARFTYRTFPKLAHSALAMAAARLVPARPAEFFSRDLREIAPTLNEDLLDLYGISEQLLANTFSFHNVSKTLPADFDWNECPGAAWRRELHAFDYALTLAMTWRISQEDRYALHLRYLVAHWIAENPPGPTAGWELEPLARRVRNWVLASDLADVAWQADREFRDVFAQSLAMQCVFLSRHADESESFATRLRSGRALLIAAKFFGTPAAEELADAGQAILSKVADEILGRNRGLDLPRPADLCDLAEACLERLLISREEPAYSHVEWAREALGVLEGVLAPDGTLPLFGPAARSRADDLSDLYAMAAVILNEPRWKSLAGRFGIYPYLVLGERGKLRFEQSNAGPWDSGTREVPECGVARLSGANRSALLINARPVSSTSDHQDFRSYELYLKGIRVVVDSGAFSPEKGPDNFASERAHNVLLVDGDRPPVRRVIFEPEEAAMPRIERLDRQGAASADSSSHESFCQRVCLSDAGLALPRVHHRRAFYCLDGAAWAVLDGLVGEGRYSLVSVIHFFPTFRLEVLEDRVIARSRALSATIIPLAGFAAAGSSGPTLEISHGADPIFPGFYSPEPGVKFSCAVLSMAAAEARLPWVGGYLIVPGDPAAYRAGRSDAMEGWVEFELFGETYRLKVS